MKYSNNRFKLLDIARELDLSQYILSEALHEFDNDKWYALRQRIERDLFGEGEDNDN